MKLREEQQRIKSSWTPFETWPWTDFELNKHKVWSTSKVKLDHPLYSVKMNASSTQWSSKVKSRKKKKTKDAKINKCIKYSKIDLTNLNDGEFN